MIGVIADNITSPLGFTSEENYRAVKRGDSKLRRYEGLWDLPEPFTASLFDEEALDAKFDRLIRSKERWTRFEKMALISARQAIDASPVDPASDRVLFILSTTKGNVSLLPDPQGFDPERVLLGVTARRIAGWFGNRNEPVTVSNACISGVCAQITAMRCLEEHLYDYAVVIGADEQSPFIVSGFQSFKALSDEACKPFSRNRCGLNLGEAAATIIYGRSDKEKPADIPSWYAIRGAIRNDANHISGPSRTGEGSYRALRYLLDDHTALSDIAFVNVHGTATLYNDEMESIAIERAGLLPTPVNALKGYYGHTMGAAGILESILSMHAVDDHTIIGTRGFDELGVSRPIDLSAGNRPTDRRAFIKLLSGFGGCNAALLFKKIERSDI